MTERWHDGQVRDMHAEMTRLTLDIVARTLFGTAIDDAGQVDIALRLVLANFAQRTNSTIPLPWLIPTPANLKLHSAVRKLNQLVRQIIDDRRRAGQQCHDLLSILLDARDEEDGGGMTDRQLLDEVRTFLLAGHETTALALTWTWYLLAGHPIVQAALKVELDAVLDDRTPQVSDVPRLKYTEQIVLEGMRLFSPSFAMGREALADCELNGYRIRAGTTVFMSQWVMHRDARYYERPDKFEPERWANQKAEVLPRFAYFPFGGGPRVCVGSQFAITECVLIVAAVARQWLVRLSDPARVIKPQPSFTLRPASPIEVIVTKRPLVQQQLVEVPLSSCSKQPDAVSEC